MEEKGPAPSLGQGLDMLMRRGDHLSADLLGGWCLCLEWLGNPASNVSFVYLLLQRAQR